MALAAYIRSGQTAQACKKWQIRWLGAAGRWVQVMVRSSGAIKGQPVNGGETGSAKEEENALKEALC